MAVHASSEVLQAFASLVQSGVDDERIDLLRAALAFCRIEYPQLDPEPYAKQVEQFARRVAEKIDDPDEPAVCIAAMNQVLFEEEMFRGNTVDYYSPCNSFMNEVLDRRLGIPITMSLLYLEVARRAGFPLFGVGMPGHFLLKHYDVSGRSILIDAFNCGAIVSEEDCRKKVKSIYSGQITLQPEFLLIGQTALSLRRQMAMMN
jgi:regulator of sirC expression with transglutaminase-like and TPR domain